MKIRSSLLFSTVFRILILALVVCVSARATTARAAEDEDSPEYRFQEVRKAFDKGAFKQASYLAETLDKDMRKKGQVSPALFELMGHIQYRQGELGAAALFYERASLFPPPVPEVRQNLRHIRAKTGSLVFAPNDVGSQLAAWLAPHQWLQIAILSAAVVILCIFLSILFVRSSGGRALLLTFAGLVLVIGSLSMLGWHWHPSAEVIKEIAVVTANDVRAYTAASSTSGPVSELPPGSEVRQLETRGAWTYVEIPGDADNNRGWVPSNALAALWPEEYSPAFLE